MIIAGIGRPAAPVLRARSTAGFAVPAGAGQAATVPAAAPLGAMDAVLALQEQEANAVRDRRARQHGQALLQALAALQHCLLGGGDEAACLHRLAAIAGAGAEAADPGLAAIIRTLSLRVAVELARHGL